MQKKKEDQKKVICFGGGNAIPKLILAPLKKYSLQITSVTSMIDNGGSTGQLRRDFNVLPPGDIRRHLLALSEAPRWKKELLKFRFGHEKFPGGHKGHSLANAFIAGLEYTLGEFPKALEILHQFLEVKGKCLPATIEQTQIIAKLENGETAFGEDEIDVPKNHDPHLKIEEVFLKPSVKAYPPVLQAIKEADLAVIGPGDLYSSVIPCLLPQGMKQAFSQTSAKKVYICNALNKLGETNSFSVLDFVEEIEKYLGEELDHVICNNFVPKKERVQQYQEEHPEFLDLVIASSDLTDDKFIAKNILLKEGPLKYDPQKIINILLSLL